jgi:hypothetical protein
MTSEMDRTFGKIVTSSVKSIIYGRERAAKAAKTAKRKTGSDISPGFVLPVRESR